MSGPVDVLVVGDGNLSFSAALAQSYVKRGKRKHLWATIFDELDVARRRYPYLNDRVQEILDCEDARILDLVDATALAERLPGQTFHCIRWNFPHPGTTPGVKENMPEMKEMHVELMEAFFKSCNAVQVHWILGAHPPQRYPPLSLHPPVIPYPKSFPSRAGGPSSPW